MGIADLRVILISPIAWGSTASLLLLGCLSAAPLQADETPAFFRGLNLNGPPLTIDGRVWEGRDSPHYVCDQAAFENQQIALVPPTDPARAQMIRSSRWGMNHRIELTNIPAGPYTVYLYVWEDNAAETFSISVSGQQVVAKHNSGKAGNWERLGPWFTTSLDGKITITSKGGAANFSGVELWQGHQDVSLDEINEEQLAFFESRIRPLLVERCYDCHSVEAGDVQGDLLVDSRAAIRRGGGTGPAVVPWDAQRSLLIQVVRPTDAGRQMPPDDPLSPEEIADLEAWVKMGAPDPRSTATKLSERRIDLETARDFWSLRPIVMPTIPRGNDTAWPRNEIDQFILVEMERRGFVPAADADKRDLIRRATFDLTGLPPTPDEVAAFLADDSTDAFERVVNRWLDAPRYGERWGRHWLDVVRYADTAGDNSDFPIPQMHLYRDWVIEAFNRDLPYDEFVRDQLAGDLRGNDVDEAERDRRIIATGYLASARRFGSRVDDYPWHLTIEDTIDNLGRGFLGMTLSCARCHDHKFDPITAHDYYGLYGIFHSTRYPWPGIELDGKQRHFVALSQPDQNAYAVADAEKREGVAVQMKGNPERLGDLVNRRFPVVLGGQELPPDHATSGREWLAEWILDAENPLPARVMANRLWQHHFGRGIVPTSNDFGRQGKPPTHPELLDYLAVTLREQGWSIKSMHRLILLSRTYQQSTIRDAKALADDPFNDWLSGYPRRRLDAESIRDTLLAVAGNLDLSSAGAHPFPEQSKWGFTQHKPFKDAYETNRRSVYLMTQRIQRHPFLANFDGADPSTSTAVRMTSTTPLQALFLLNDSFTHEQARLFAERVRASSSDPRQRIDHAYEWLFARPATSWEADSAASFFAKVTGVLRDSGTPDDHLDSEAWQAYVRSLFRLNEFVYLN